MADRLLVGYLLADCQEVTGSGQVVMRVSETCPVLLLWSVSVLVSVSV